jgi:hypothetical protein
MKLISLGHKYLTVMYRKMETCNICSFQDEFSSGINFWCVIVEFYFLACLNNWG